MHHLLIHFQFAYRVWKDVINMFEMEWVMPRMFVMELFGKSPPQDLLRLNFDEVTLYL